MREEYQLIPPNYPIIVEKNQFVGPKVAIDGLGIAYLVGDRGPRTNIYAVGFAVVNEELITRPAKKLEEEGFFYLEIGFDRIKSRGQYALSSTVTHPCGLGLVTTIYTPKTPDMIQHQNELREDYNNPNLLTGDSYGWEPPECSVWDEFNLMGLPRVQDLSQLRFTFRWLHNF